MKTTILNVPRVVLLSLVGPFVPK